MKSVRPWALAPSVALLFLAWCPAAQAQFRDDFDTLRTAPDGLTGWSFFTGDGRARMTLEQLEPGSASILVDATDDRQNIWWALIKRKVSGGMDLALLERPDRDLRIQARIRVSHAPRRVNLHLNTQRTTDFHSHLMEFDIADANVWHTISFTTRGFDARPGDTVFGQLALMDWGLGRYRVDVDSFHVDVVDPATAGPDRGEQVPYHPPIPAAGRFRMQVPVAHDAVIDASHPDVNLDGWSVLDGPKANATRVLAIGGTQDVILRFDLSAYKGLAVAGSGLLELTTRVVQRSIDRPRDFGLARVVEILGGDPLWDQRSVTADTLRRGRPLADVLNPQMIVDWPVAEGDRNKTYFTLSRPVLQRLIDGRTLGLAIRPLGSIMASFYASEADDAACGPRLLFNLQAPPKSSE
jgi:hypothetical protein